MRRLPCCQSTTGLGLILLAASLLPGASAPQTPPTPAPDAPATTGSPSAESSANDSRLQQKVTVHATSQRVADLLAWLTQVTGVTLMPRMEVAEERLTLWAEDRPLIDVMRDLRHLHGYYWSRSKQSGEWVYSLWQDAQSKAREEAEVQRWALAQQREFERGIQQRVRALSASDEELKRLAREDPYLIVQTKHPVIRNAYQLFATLSPDQQAQLTQARTPSRGLSFGEDMQVFPRESRPEDKYFNPREWTDLFQPQGDIVTLGWGEMTAAQQRSVREILRGAASRLEDEARREKERHPDEAMSWEPREIQARAAAAGDPTTAAITFFRWGDPTTQGLSLRVDFQSSGRDWAIYSNIGAGPGLYREMFHQGEATGVPGVSPEAERLLADMAKQGAWRSPAPPPPVFDPAPDPALDAPLSFAWELPLREGFPKNSYALNGNEVMAALHREIRHPLIVDGLPQGLHQERSAGPRFRWEKRPVRELLARFFPGWKGEMHEGSLFLRNPERLKWALNQVPRAVEQFLEERKGPPSLDDMALLARSLSPWQVVKLQEYLPHVAIDQTLAAQELLKLYGELSPEQRTALAQGLPFAGLTPPQQALFLQFAQRRQPFVEPWRFQQGSLRVTLGSSPVKDDGRGRAAISRAVFQVRLGDEAAQAFPIDLFPSIRPRQVRGLVPLASFIGKPFPGFWENNRISSPGDEPVWEPSLNDPRLQKKPAVILITRPYAEPFVGTQPPVATVAWARGMARRLQTSGIAVAHLTVGPKEAPAPPSGAADAPNLILLWEPGDINGEPFDSAGSSEGVPQSPTVFLVDRDGIVRAVFEGMAVWDAAVIERAARRLGVSQITGDAR
jgi:hypothetical protein